MYNSFTEIVVHVKNIYYYLDLVYKLYSDLYTQSSTIDKNVLFVSSFQLDLILLKLQNFSKYRL